MIWIVNIEISKNRNKEIKDIESKNIGEWWWMMEFKYEIEIDFLGIYCI
jgi:hypothetical protein